MTANQIAWFNATEQQRANYARERETNRANVAAETERNRSNVATETESRRANLAREAAQVESNRISLLSQQAAERHYVNQDKVSAAIANENARHNAVIERLQQQGASIDQFNAETARYNASISALNAEANRSSAAASLLNAKTNQYSAETNRKRVESQNRADVWNNQLTMARTGLTNQQRNTEIQNQKYKKHEVAQGWFNTAIRALQSGTKLLGGN